MLEQFWRGYQPYEVIIELAVIWICVYLAFRFLRGTRGAGVIKGIAVVLVVVTLVIRVLGQDSDAFGRLNFIYTRFLGLLALLLIVVFQPELRQAMIRLGHNRWLRGGSSASDRTIQAISDAAAYLSKNRFGALIAVERNVQLGGLVEGGEVLDAEISSRLLESIFWPNNPLHDLGVVVREERIVAANVQFPLAEEGLLSRRYGSRHRAAIGLTLDSDCIVVVVSEETGAISIAEHGRLEPGIPVDQVREVLAERLRAKAIFVPDEKAEFTRPDDAPPDEPSGDDAVKSKSKVESDDVRVA